MDTKIPNYLKFSHFNEIKLHFGNPAEGLNYGYTALPNFKIDQNPLFEDSYFILYRRSEYAAQVELACSEIFITLMGYGPSMKIVEENGEFYIASRKIKG